MKQEQANLLVNLLSQKGIIFVNGLTDAEIIKTQNQFSFEFPPDLKLFLQTQLPVSHNFINWRLALSDQKYSIEVCKYLIWPLEGMLFDIEENDFWLADWSIKPNTKEERKIVATNHFKTYPTLIPICSHRYIPGFPNEIDNPVFSVYQMDIIYYGNNLADYLSHEFKFTLDASFKPLEAPKNIPFWSWCVENNI